MNRPSPFDIPEFCNAEEWASRAHSEDARTAMEDLLAFGRNQAAMARAFAAAGAPVEAAAFERLAREFGERCLRLFAPPAGAALTARYQSALAAHGAVLASVAAEAARRFSAELADGRGAPITTLRELQAIWIDCGERAFNEAAHGEAFAASQAELLAAWVELKAGK